MFKELFAIGFVVTLILGVTWISYAAIEAVVPECKHGEGYWRDFYADTGATAVTDTDYLYYASEVYNMWVRNVGGANDSLIVWWNSQSKSTSGTDTSAAHALMFYVVQNETLKIGAIGIDTVYFTARSGTTEWIITAVR